MPEHSFKKWERIRKKKEFDRVFSQGRRGNSRFFSWVMAPNGEGKTRFGIVAGRKVGHAVRRNRIKRLLREVFRLNKKRFPAGYDIIVIVKRGIPALSYNDVVKEIADLFTEGINDSKISQ